MGATAAGAVAGKAMNEAASPELKAPPLRRRMACWLYEGMLLFGVVFLAGYLFGTLSQTRNALDNRHALQAFLFVVFGIYFTWFWSRGQSLAMKTWDIRLVDHPDIPGLHCQCLAAGPEPAEVDAEHHDQECLQERAARVHRITHLSQRAEEPAGDEHDREQQHAFIDPARHAPRQARRHQGCVVVQLTGAAVGAGPGWGSRVLGSTWLGAAAILGGLASSGPRSGAIF